MQIIGEIESNLSYQLGQCMGTPFKFIFHDPQLGRVNELLGVGEVVGFEDDRASDKDRISNLDLAIANPNQQIEFATVIFGGTVWGLNRSFHLDSLSVAIPNAILKGGVHPVVLRLDLGHLLEIEPVPVQRKHGEGSVHGDYAWCEWLRGEDGSR